MSVFMYVYSECIFLYGGSSNYLILRFFDKGRFGYSVGYSVSFRKYDLFFILGSRIFAFRVR